MGGTTAFDRTVTQVEPGSLLVLYTDGLVERRGHSLDVGLDRLAAVAATAGREPEQACDTMVAEMLREEGPVDDVALLAVSVRGP